MTKIRNIPSEGAVVDRAMIISFYCIEILSRGLLLAIIPLELLARFESTQFVTWFYAAIAIAGLGNSLIVPQLIRRTGTRISVASAGILIIAAALLLSTPSLIVIAFGLAVRALATACIEMPLTAYMMERIPRRSLGTFEPMRLFFQGSCLALAPWLGFHLYTSVSKPTPFVLAAVGGGATLLLALLMLPRTRQNLTMSPVPHRPIEAFARFFRQPRLRLAWCLALVRASFWTIFLIYTPIYSVICGWTPSAGAALLSLGSCCHFLIPIWGSLARRFGARRMMITGYSLAGIAFALTAIAGVWAPSVAPFGLPAAAIAMSIVDGPGNVPFLRATRPLERPGMAGVYVTYRDVSQFAPIAMFSLVLVITQLPAAFAAYAVILCGAAWFSQFLHPRLR